MARWLLVVLVLVSALIDIIVCPPVTDKPPMSTPSPEAEDDVVSTTCVQVCNDNFYVCGTLMSVICCRYLLLRSLY